MTAYADGYAAGRAMSIEEIADLVDQCAAQYPVEFFPPLTEDWHESEGAAIRQFCQALAPRIRDLAPRGPQDHQEPPEERGEGQGVHDTPQPRKNAHSATP